MKDKTLRELYKEINAIQNEITKREQHHKQQAQQATEATFTVDQLIEALNEIPRDAKMIVYHPDSDEAYHGWAWIKNFRYLSDHKILMYVFQESITNDPQLPEWSGTSIELDLEKDND